ncbi:MAG TPA: hypothetical protein VI259_10895 [Gemmatimonadaceae bacterium]
MLPKTIHDVWTAIPERLRPDDSGYVRDVLLAAGIKIDDDGKTLIYPSTQGTDTPRYQIQEQRNIRSRGARRRR